MRRDSNRFAAQDFVCSGDDGLAPAGMTTRVKTGSHVCDLPLRCFQASLRGPDIKFFCLASRPQSSLKKLGVSGLFNVEDHLEKKTSQSLWKKDLLKTDGRSAS